jgi:hypothetical protein
MGLSIMLFKHNADRRHHIPKMRLRVTNWRQYEAGLRRRGSLTRCREAAKAAACKFARNSDPLRGGFRVQS